MIRLNVFYVKPIHVLHNIQIYMCKSFFFFLFQNEYLQSV